jgi:hypothetical protein
MIKSQTPPRMRPGCMTKILPPGKYGRAQIVHDSPSPLERIRGDFNGLPLTADQYCRLIADGQVWMTDAEFEIRTNLGPVLEMQGEVLVAGLGIGLVLAHLPKAVTSVTVIERHPDVIALVAPHFPKATIIQADARKWEPPRRAFDCVYLDIWADVPNDKEEIRALKKKYRPAVRKGGWVGAWCQHYSRR